MNRINNSIILALVCITFSACRIVHKDMSGPLVTKDFQVSSFEKIKLYGPNNVFFKRSDTIKVYAVTTEKMMEELRIFTEGKTLVVTTEEKKNVIRIGNAGISADIYVQAPSLSMIQITGSGTFECSDSLSSEKFSANVTGSGDIRMGDIVCKSADISITGSGDIRLGTLSANRTSVTISGSGDITMSEKDVQKTDISITGSGDIEMALDNCDEAVATISGSGDITLTGTLNKLKKSVSGSGEITTQGLTIRK